MNRSLSWQLASVAPVWVLVLVAAVFVGLYSPTGDTYTWLPIVLAASVILAFAVQLAIRQKEGFVLRVMASVTGAVVVLGVATAVLALIA